MRACALRHCQSLWPAVRSPMSDAHGCWIALVMIMSLRVQGLNGARLAGRCTEKWCAAG